MQFTHYRWIINARITFKRWPYVYSAQTQLTIRFECGKQWDAIMGRLSGYLTTTSVRMSRKKIGGGEQRANGEMQSRMWSKKKSANSWLSYFSGVDLLSVDGEKKLGLAILQLDPVRVHLEEAHPFLHPKQRNMDPGQCSTRQVKKKTPPKKQGNKNVQVKQKYWP